jgi:hypothetical protein
VDTATPTTLKKDLLNILSQIKEKRYHEAYLADRRRLVLLGAGGFLEKQIECLWEDVPHSAYASIDSEKT